MFLVNERKVPGCEQFCQKERFVLLLPNVRVGSFTPQKAVPISYGFRQECSLGTAPS